MGKVIKKVKFKLSELRVLQYDLNAVLRENIDIGVKADVYRMLEAIESRIETHQKLNLELYKKYGTDNGDNTYSIKGGVSDEAQKEFDALNNKEEEVVSYIPAKTLSGFKTEHPYTVIWKLFR